MSLHKLLLVILPWLASAWTISRNKAASRREHSASTFSRQTTRYPSVLRLSSVDSKSDDDEKNTDWRDFRAKLVLGEKNAAKNNTSWAYDSGYVIEEGTVLLSSINQDFGYGLKQQYFHKCIILVMCHDNRTFTKGIILNRPTNLVLSDADFVYENGTSMENVTQESRWRMWYGGEVQGLASDSPEIVCLHSLANKAASEVSENVMKSISWTTIEGARKLVSDGDATSDDFMVFCGYAGWSPGQLKDELERECWYTVAADSQTIWDVLQSSAKNQSNAIYGTDAWEQLMERIDRGNQVGKVATDFDDKMLQEWGQTNLVFNDDRVAIGQSNFPLPQTSPHNVTAGSLLRASAAEHCPFLLSNQEFFKSVVLVTQDEANFTIGVLLNRPLPDVIELVIPVPDNQTRNVKIVERYGGRFGVKGDSEKRTFWFHCSARLRDLGVGSPLGEHDGIWKCSRQDVCRALHAGEASEKDFIAVTGFNVWPKGLNIGK
jgi:putative AlgH/UPF0301 family transcriptional regulator